MNFNQKAWLEDKMSNKQFQNLVIKVEKGKSPFIKNLTIMNKTKTSTQMLLN